MDCSPPGSSVHGICWARTLEWVAISFFRGSSHPGIKPVSPALQADSLLLNHFLKILLGLPFAFGMKSKMARPCMILPRQLLQPSLYLALFRLHSVPEDAELILPTKPLHLLLPQPKTVSPTDGVCFFSIMSLFKSQGSH